MPQSPSFWNLDPWTARAFALPRWLQLDLPDPVRHPFEATRTWLVVAVSLTNAVAGGSMLLLLAAVAATPWLPLLIGVLTLLTVVVPCSLLRASRTDTASTVLCALLTAGPLVAVPIGGAEVFVTPWQAIPPLLAALLLGPRAALAFGGAVAGGVAVSLGAWSRGLVPWETVAYPELVEGATTLVAILVIAGIGVVQFGAVTQTYRLLGAAQARARAELEEGKLRDAEIAELHEQLAEAARQHGIAQSTASVLHDVHNVVNVIAAAPDLLTERLEELEELTPGESPRPVLLALHEELRYLREAVTHLVAILQRRHRPALDPQPLDLAELVRDVLHLRRPLLEKHGIVVTSELAEAPARTDRHTMLHILNNLVQNAVESLRETDGSERRLHVGTRRSEEGVRLEVSDTGVGLSPDAMELVFARGFTTKEEGTGFGLHNCRQLAEHLQGDITVQSDGIERGATFVLTLPADPGSEG